MVYLETSTTVAMTCSSRILKLQVIVVGLDMRDVNLAASLTDDLGILDHFRSLDRRLDVLDR